MTKLQSRLLMESALNLRIAKNEEEKLEKEQAIQAELERLEKERQLINDAAINVISALDYLKSRGFDLYLLGTSLQSSKWVIGGAPCYEILLKRDYPDIESEEKFISLTIVLKTSSQTKMILFNVSGYNFWSLEELVDFLAKYALELYPTEESNNESKDKSR